MKKVIVRRVEKPSTSVPDYLTTLPLVRLHMTGRFPKDFLKVGGFRGRGSQL